MKILLVDDEGAPAPDAVVAALQAAGHVVEVASHAPRQLLKRVEAMQPDIVLIDTESPTRDVLEPLCILTAHNPLPLVMFSSDGSGESIRAATDAGVTAYLVQHLDAAELEPVLAVAQARFSREQKLRQQLEDSERQAADRQVVDTAKGMLMASLGLAEEEAWRQLQQASMKSGLPIARVAARLVKRLS